MADRTVIVGFEADLSKLRAGFREARGLTADAVQDLKSDLTQLADASDQSANRVARGVTTLLSNLSRIGQQGDVTEGTLKALGLSSSDMARVLHGPTLEAVDVVTQALDRFQDRTLASSIAQRLMGRDADAVVLALRKSREAVHDSGEEAKDSAAKWGTFEKAVVAAGIAAGGIYVARNAVNALASAWSTATSVTYDAVAQQVEAGHQAWWLAQQLSVGSEKASAFAIASRQAGLDVDSLGRVIRRTSQAIASAKDPASDAFRIFTTGLGMTRQQIARLQTADPVDQLLALVAAFNATGDSAEKRAAMVTVFGRAYEDLVGLMAEGPDVFRANMERAKELGATWDAKTTAAATRLRQAGIDLDSAWSGVQYRIAASPALFDGLSTALSRGADELARIGREIPQQDIDALHGAVVRLTTALVHLASEGLGWLLEHLPTITGYLGMAADNMGRFARYAGGVTLSTLTGAAAGSVVPGIGTITGGLAGFTTGMLGVSADLLTNPINAATNAEKVLYQQRQARLTQIDREIGQLQTLDVVQAGVASRELDHLHALQAERERLLGLISATTTTTSAAFTPLSAHAPGTAPSGTPREGAGTPKPPFGLGPTQTAAAKAEAEAIRAIFLREQEELTAAEQDGAERRLAIVRRYTAEVTALAGAKSQATIRQQQIELRAQHDVVVEAATIARTRIATSRDAALAELELRKKALEAEAAAGRITHGQMRDALRTYYDERFKIIAAALEAEGTLTNDPAAQAALAGRLSGAEAERKGGKLGVDLEQYEAEALRIKNTINTVFGAFDQAADRSVQGLIQGTLTWKQAWANAGQSVLAQFVSIGVHMVTSFAGNIAKMVALHLLGEASKTAATASGTATRRTIEATSGLKEVFIAAKTAAAKAYSAMSGIPYVGPALGAVAAAAAFAAVIALGAGITSAEGGLGRVPFDNFPALLHADEAVLPKAMADVIRQLAAAGGSTRAGFLAGVAQSAGGVPGEPGGPPFLSAQGGLDRVPPGGAVAVLHPDEKVLPAGGVFVPHDVAPGEADTSAEGGGAGGPAGRSGRPGTTSTGLGSVTAVVPYQAKGASGGTGPTSIQRVSVVSAPATVSTKATGPVETTTSQPVPTTTVGGAPMPVQEQGTQAVNILNVPMPVTFTAIQTMATVSLAPLGIGVTFGVGTINAFRRGGEVPAEGLAYLHPREIVFPEPLADRVRTMTTPGALAKQVTAAMAGPVMLPADVQAALSEDTRQPRAAGQLGAGVSAARDADRRALAESVASALPGGGDTYHTWNVDLIDTDGLEGLVNRNKDIFAAPAFDKLARTNRGTRARR